MVDWKNEDLNRGEQDETMSIMLLSRAIDFGKIHTVAAEMQAQDVQWSIFSEKSTWGTPWWTELVEMISISEFRGQQ